MGFVIGTLFTALCAILVGTGVFYGADALGVLFGIATLSMEQAQAIGTLVFIVLESGLVILCLICG
ncbi:hypothetical protein BH10PSE7_BH10PSE7_15120 [soil metagenome]